MRDDSAERYWWGPTRSPVPADSPSRGGNVAVYVSDTNRSSLLAPFYSAPVSIFLFMALSTVFHSKNSPKMSQKFFSLSSFSLCSFGLISALLVISAIYLFIKVSFNPDIILCGCLGSKYQLTNLLTISPWGLGREWRDHALTYAHTVTIRMILHQDWGQYNFSLLCH